MGWPAAESEMSRGIGLLVVISGVACATISLLYILSAALPIYIFRGYVEGYYSMLDYRLHYVHNQRPVLMPHTDYIRGVSIVFTLLSLALLALSLASLLLVRRKTLVASGLIYGVALGLGVLNGLLNGYICRAVDSDLRRFSYLLGDEVVYRTLAGIITFSGVRVERTLAHTLIFASPALLVLLAVAISTSALATGLSLYSFHKHARYTHIPRGASLGGGLRGGLLKLRSFEACSALALTSLALLASAFTYYPSTAIIAPQPPPATLEAPAPVYTCTLTRINRSAIVYTDFETYPIAGWTAYGGSWNSTSGVAGAKGNVLYGENVGPSLGSAAFYHYSGPAEGYSALWVVTRTQLLGGAKPYYGLAMLSGNRTRAFAVMIYRHSAVIGYLQIWSYNVTTTTWTQHVSTSIPNYSPTTWYTIATYYNVSGSTVNITANLYDGSGNYVASTSWVINHSNVFTPAHVGVIVYDEIPGRTASAYFDEFIASPVDPRSILFTGLQAGTSVEVRDNYGDLVASGTATGANLSLSVVRDVVVGNGTNGRILVILPDGSLCADHRVPHTDAILGGDVYRVERLSTIPVDVVLGANKTSAIASTALPGGGPESTIGLLRVNTSQALYARLLLNSISAPETLKLDIWIEGAFRSTNVTIRDGTPVSTSTNIVQLNIGLNNNVTLAGYFTSTGQSATLNLKLELCTAPEGKGACVYYPIVLNLSS